VANWCAVTEGLLMEYQAAAPSAQAFWNQVLEAIDGDAETLTAQREAATEQFPELTSAFGLLLAYVHHLHGTLLTLTPLPPDPGTPPPIDFPREICQNDRLICDCAHGDTGACRALGVYGERPVGILSCEGLWDLYRQAVERATRAIIEASGGRPVHIDEGILRQIDPSVGTHWRALVAARCVDVGYMTEYSPP
jgi:hypothetical protein